MFHVDGCTHSRSGQFFSCSVLIDNQNWVEVLWRGRPIFINLLLHVIINLRVFLNGTHFDLDILDLFARIIWCVTRNSVVISLDRLLSLLLLFFICHLLLLRRLRYL